MSRIGTSKKAARRRKAKQRARDEKLLVESLETRILLAADVVGLDPADDAADIAIDSNLVATFSDPLRIGPGTGNILIHNVDDNSLIEALNVRSDQVTIDGSTITIDPSAALPGNTNISVRPAVAKVRDLGTEVTPQTIFAEDFEGLPLTNSVLDAPFDEYVVAMTGVLDVKTAGDYTFGGHNEDGSFLSIDVAQDGLDIFDDTLFEDDSQHGDDDRLHTCDSVFAEGVNEIESCVGEGLEDAVTLAVGEYPFYYAFFNAGGSGSGEFIYAAGYHEIYDESSFAVVGDDSQGIGVTADGITITTYKEVAPNEINNLGDAFALIDDDSTIIGSEKVDFADVAESGEGRFAHDNAIPGAEQWSIDNDPNFENWTDEGPYDWTRDNSDLIEGGAPEYNGWTFMDKEFWIAEQGNQSRTDYELAEGTVALVDPDAHDDFINNGSFDAAACLEVLEFGPECGLFTASLSTPEIYLDGVAEGTATLGFDSSWWDEDTQSAETRVEYFDAAGESLGVNVLLRWESIGSSENYKPQMQDDINARNEEVEVAMDNPAEAASMVITFDMPYATNDWWWAIDNIEVTADVEGIVSAGINDDTTWNFATGEGTGGGSDLSDVTAPGDALVRVDGENDGDANDGPPPATETVEHVIDDVSQKHLNFLDLNSGFIVTPSAGPTNVTGLRLYSANDAVERDPASYKLEGGSADGSFTVISEGELSLPADRNAGGDIAIDTSLAHEEILFENSGVYESYRLTFPTVKDADASCCMQIAEVEFLGEVAEVAKSDVTAPGDLLERVDGENDGDANDGPPPATETVEHVIDDVTQKHLNFLDLNSGFIVTPSAGDSVVTGLRLYSANDAVERDPASYKLEGGSGDGSFTLISEGELALPEGRNAGGDIPIETSLFNQEISFENTEAYSSYRLTFPTVKDADASCCMQIAEVEFLGDVIAAPAPPIDVSAGTAAQSSQLSDFVAEFGVDDVVNFTHTLAGDENPTWQVLLPNSYAFDSVTVFNRGASEGTLSCCPSRLRDITIQIVDFSGDVTTDFTGGTVVSESDLLNPENVLGGGTNTDGPISLSDDAGGAVGNLIRVIRTPDDDLSGSGGEGNDDEGSVLSIDLVAATGTPVSSGLPADIDGDGEVGFSDFLILSDNFGQEVDPGTDGDIDGNGVVEFADFLILSATFGDTAAAAVDAVFAGE